MVGAPGNEAFSPDEIGPEELDPIVAEVRRTRDRYSSALAYDLRRIAADLREREARHAERLISLPPRPPVTI